jgi:predicted nucleic acid-binding protein
MDTKDLYLYFAKYSFTFWSLVVTVCTTGFGIEKFYTQNMQCIYVVFNHLRIPHVTIVIL